MQRATEWQEVKNEDLYGPFGLVYIIVYKLTRTYILVYFSMTDHSRDCIPWLGNSKMSVLKVIQNHYHVRLAYVCSHGYSR